MDFLNVNLKDFEFIGLEIVFEFRCILKFVKGDINVFLNI